MKKMLSLTALYLGAALFLTTRADGQVVATDVSCYVFTCSLPDVSTLEFGTARDNMMGGLKTLGYPTSTQTRIGNPTGIEVRNVFEANDICVSSNSFLWRGQLTPPAPYQPMHGNRLYASLVLIGKDGQVSLSRMEYRVLCDIPLYNNASSQASLNYSVSRIGVLSGPDGILFTPDDVILNTGPGTVLVDAVIFIGARVGSEVSNQADIDNVSAAIAQLGPNGMQVAFEYHYVLSPGNFVSQSFHTTVYPNGTIPQSFNRLAPFGSPNGMLFSVVGPANSAPMILETTRDIEGPWNVVNGSAKEGTSGFAAFTRNPTNDHAFFRLRANSAITSLSGAALARAHFNSVDSRALLAAHPSADADQDGPLIEAE